MAREEFTALLGAGTEYQGQLNFKGTVRIDGRFHGDISSEGKLILGKEAQVDASVSVNELVVHGVLRGVVRVAKRVTLHQTAQVFAAMHTPSMIMEQGAVLQGELQMRPDEKQTAGENALEPLRQNTAKTIRIADEHVKQ